PFMAVTSPFGYCFQLSAVSTFGWRWSLEYLFEKKENIYFGCDNRKMIDLTNISIANVMIRSESENTTFLTNFIDDNYDDVPRYVESKIKYLMGQTRIRSSSNGENPYGKILAPEFGSLPNANYELVVAFACGGIMHILLDRAIPWNNLNGLEIRD